MAEDTTPVEGQSTESGNGAPAPDDHAAKIVELKAKAKAAGLQVFDSSEMHGLKTKAAAAAEAKYAESQTKLDATQAELIKANEYKARIEDKDKSDGELHADQRRAWQTSDSEKDKAIKLATADLKAAHEALGRERVQNKIRALMPDTHSPEMALMWAEKHVGKFLSTDDAGQLVWTDPTGVPHVGIAAEKNFSDWWQSDAQKSLRTGQPAGPPTLGAPSAPAPQAQGEYKRDPAKTAMENYVAAEEWDAKQKGKQ